jgi:hypothetical protein
MGAEKWLELLICGPFSLRDELLRKCSLFVQRHIQACRQAGAQLCVYAAPFSTPGMLTPPSAAMSAIPGSSMTFRSPARPTSSCMAAACR